MFFVLFVRDQHVPVSGTDYVGSRFWNRNAKGGVAGVCMSEEGSRSGGGTFRAASRALHVFQVHIAS